MADAEGIEDSTIFVEMENDRIFPGKYRLRQAPVSTRLHEKLSSQPLQASYKITGKIDKVKYVNKEIFQFDL